MLSTFFSINEFSYLNIEQKKVHAIERERMRKKLKFKQLIVAIKIHILIYLLFLLALSVHFFIIFLCFLFVSFFACAYTTRVPISDKNDNPNFLCHPLLRLTSENCVFLD